MILPVEAWKACIDHDGIDWSSMSGYLTLVMDTTVGLHIFAGPLEKLNVINTTALIDTAVNDLFMQSGVTAACIKNAREKLAETLEEGGRDLFLAIKPLEMQLSYRGVVFPILVASYIDLSS